MERTTRRARRLRALGLLTTLGLVVAAGCGDEDDDASSSSTTTTEADSRPTGDPITIAALWGAVDNPYFESPQLDNVFGVTTAFPSYSTMIVIAAKEAGLTIIGTAAAAEYGSSEEGAELAATTAEAIDIGSAGYFTVAADAPDFTAECLQFIEADVDFLQLIVGDDVATRLVEECRAQGYDGWFGASGGTVAPALFEGLGSDATVTGGLNVFPWFVDDEPVVRFRDVMEANGVAPDVYSHPTAMAPWVTMELFTVALESNADTLPETLTRQVVLDAYYTIEDETLDGLLPSPVTYVEGEPAPPQRCFWLYTYEDGEFSGSFTPTCPEDHLEAGS